MATAPEPVHPPAPVVPEDEKDDEPVPDRPDRLVNTCLDALALLPLPQCFCVREREAGVQLFCGKYTGTITEPGCYCRNGFCITIDKISTAITTVDLHNTRVVDLRGNPLIISGIVTYQVVEPRRAVLEVDRVSKFVTDQAPAVLKRVVATFPYEAEEGVCLKTEAGTVVSAELKRVLQSKTKVAGVKILSFMLNELSYAPEIANVMLKRQAADALLDARSRIVKGTVEIAKEASASLTDAEITPSDKSHLMANLLTVLVGEKEVAPVVNVSGH